MKVSTCKGFSQYFDLVFNNLALDLTDIDLFLYLTEFEIENVMKDSEIKEKIYKLFERKLLENQSLKTNKIFNKLYAKKFN